VRRRAHLQGTPQRHQNGPDNRLAQTAGRSQFEDPDESDWLAGPFGSRISQPAVGQEDGPARTLVPTGWRARLRHQRLTELLPLISAGRSRPAFPYPLYIKAVRWDAGESYHVTSCHQHRVGQARSPARTRVVRQSVAPHARPQAPASEIRALSSSPRHHWCEFAWDPICPHLSVGCHADQLSSTSVPGPG